MLQKVIKGIVLNVPDVYWLKAHITTCHTYHNIQVGNTFNACLYNFLDIPLLNE